MFMWLVCKCYREKLTLATGESFPALFADAGEGVPSSHTGSTVGTRTGGTCAVLGCGTSEKYYSQKHKHSDLHNQNTNIAVFFLTWANLEF